MILNLLNRRKKLSSKNRSLRLQILTNMALSGKTYDEIYSKILTWGVAEQTAKSYMKAILSRVQSLQTKQLSKILSNSNN